MAALPDVFDPARWLGRRSDDPGVIAFLQHLKIPRMPQAVIDEAEDPRVAEPQDWLPNRHLGIELGFEDEGTFLGRHPDEQGTGGMLLTQAYLYGDHPNVKPFSGGLPLSLDLADDRPTVRRKMAEWESTRRSWIRDTWELPRYRVTVSYAGHGVRIGFLLFALRPAPQSADRDDVALVPDIRVLLGFLGTPLSDPDLQRLLRPLQLERSLSNEGGVLVADYSDSFGLEMQFRHVSGSRDPVLARLTFFSDENIDVIRWPGMLPFGISFGDSPETMLARVPQAPERLEELEDGSFLAISLWHFSRFTLHVEFNSMENLILRVQILAPDAWVEG